MKKEIELCMHIKSVQQISKKLNLFKGKYQPKEYKIKITWMDTNEAY